MRMHSYVQCCFSDLRCALPCDASKLPITVGILGCLCVNLDRKDLCSCCSKYQECDLDRFLPCFDQSCFGFDERKFESTPLNVSMGKRLVVYARDLDGNMIVCRHPTFDELWHYRTFEKRNNKREKKDCFEY